MNFSSMVKCSLTDAIATKQDILAALPTLIVEGVLDSETAALRAYKPALKSQNYREN